PICDRESSLRAQRSHYSHSHRTARWRASTKERDMSRSPHRWNRLLALLAICSVMFASLLGAAPPALAAGSVSLMTLGSTYSENFDSLASTGTSSTVPNGWAFLETGTNANTTYTAGTGSSNAGDTYSFGTPAGNVERAFGGLQSGSLIPTIGAS